MAKNKDRKKFDRVLLESVDEALTSLGENIKKSIYFHLENEFALPRQDIPYRVDDFSDALERIFGLGARHLEILIMKSLHQKVSCQYSWEGPKWLVPDLTFKKYVALLRLCHEDQRQIKGLEVKVLDGQQQERHI